MRKPRGKQQRPSARKPGRVDRRQSEALFGLLVSGVRDFAIFMLGLEGHVTTWNEGAARIKGYADKEILGEHYRRFFTPEDAAAGKPERLLETALREGHAEDQGWRVRKDGSRFFADAVITVLFDPDRQPIGFAKITRDVTERARMQEAEHELAARAQRQAMLERIRAFAVNIPGLAYRRVLQPDGSVVYPFLGGRYVELLGLSPEAAMEGGVDLMKVTHPEDRASLRDAMERSARDLTTAELEARLILASGEVRWMHSRSTPRPQPDGSIVWEAISFDVTERRNAERRLRLLQATSLAVAEAPDFSSALFVVLREICAATGWEYGDAWVLDRTETKLVHGPAWHTGRPELASLVEMSRSLSVAPGEGVVGAAWLEREFLWVPDFAAWPNVRSLRMKRALEAGVVSVSALPIRAGNETLAVLSFASLERRERDEGLATTITTVATQLATALQRKRAEQALRESEERLDRAQEIAGIGSWELDVETDRYVWSPQMYRLRGLSPETFEPARDNLAPYLDPEDVARSHEWVDRIKRGEDAPPIEIRIVRPDGKTRIVSVEGAATKDASGKILRVAGTMRDVTEAREAQRQLMQAQKMEAIGSLTGGMAHDFNNLLAIIIGNLDLLNETVSEEGEARTLLSEATDAAVRGSDLVRRLLAFARQQPLQPERLDIRTLVSDAATLLRRTLGESIEVAVDDRAEVWPIIADRIQLQAAITNLATNARDAMPNGGRLTIRVANQHLDRDYASTHSEVNPGDYAMIEVSDSGIGIEPELLPRIFEPFFTTKETGKGTGLGLSMVFGFMKQSGGHVSVYSELGVGTTFRLYLPRAGEGAGTAIAEPAPAEPVRGGRELILAVEDNAHLRQLLERQLRDLGYPVIFAASAHAALEMLERSDAVRLLFTDVVMPGGMNGVELAREAVARRPGLRVLLTSGFPDAAMIARAEPGTTVPRLLSKPYRKEDLAHVLRQILEGEAP